MVAQVNNGVRDYKKFVAQVNKNKKKQWSLGFQNVIAKVNNGVRDFKKWLPNTHVNNEVLDFKKWSPR